MAGRKYKPLTLTPINFSLTEGTSIPAPLDSPPDPPRPPTPGKGPLSSHPTPKSSYFPQHRTASPADAAASTDGHTLRESSTNDNASTLSPASPTGRRPSSVRKFLGFRPQSSHDSLKSTATGPPATPSTQPSLTRKKSGSWFGKSRRQSTFVIGSVPEGRENVARQSNGTSIQPPSVQPAPPPKKKGPPPPALPELRSFGVSQDSLSLGADDMFKNIK